VYRRNQGYNLPDWVGKTSYRCNYTPGWDSYLPYWGCSFLCDPKFSEVSISHDDLSQHISSLSFSSSTLPSPKNMKSSHPSLSFHAMFKSYHQVQHTPHTASTNSSIPTVPLTLRTASVEDHWSSRSQPVFSFLSRPWYIQFRTFPQLQVNQ
jgi:hypothetical protein